MRRAKRDGLWWEGQGVSKMVRRGTLLMRFGRVGIRVGMEEKKDEGFLRFRVGWS